LLRFAAQMTADKLSDYLIGLNHFIDSFYGLILRENVGEHGSQVLNLILCCLALTSCFETLGLFLWVEDCQYSRHVKSITEVIICFLTEVGIYNSSIEFHSK
jgi:hypothetical protein